MSNSQDVIKSFSCRVDNVKSITDILNCLCIDMTKGQHCDVEATPESKMLAVHNAAIVSLIAVVVCWAQSSVLHRHREGKGHTGIAMLYF
jgi:hypothetical protein